MSRSVVVAWLFPLLCIPLTDVFGQRAGTATRDADAAETQSARGLSWMGSGKLLMILREDAKSVAATGLDVTPILSDIEFLRQKWKDARAEHPSTPAQYAEDLRDDRQALQEISEHEKPTVADIELLGAIADDLHVKASHCRAGASWDELVTVHVHTKRHGTTVGHKQVMVCRRGWANVPSKWHALRKLSSPAVGELPPGAYVFRVESQPPMAQRVGGNGHSTYDFDLVIP